MIFQHREIENMKIEVIQADYLNEQHQQEIPMLLNLYASDPMGGGEPLSEEAMDSLVPELAKLPHALSVICYVNGVPAGLVNCFEVFSTFQCKPIMNIHDVVVASEFRGHGICQKMFDKVEEIARERGCCKMTLEVLSKNEVAKSAYQNFGFSDYELDPEAGTALFWEKPI
jgi:ribosomal protein S18 acetylase RimI-like enzyme